MSAVEEFIQPQHALDYCHGCVNLESDVHETSAAFISAAPFFASACLFVTLVSPSVMSNALPLTD
jgi:hypothetical protein